MDLPNGVQGHILLLFKDFYCTMTPRRWKISAIFLVQDWTVTSFVSPPHNSNKILAHWSVLKASLDEEERTEESTLLIEQRNLRFAGVGRLYTSNSQSVATVHQDEHLQIVDRLAKANVLVVGLGGVGSWAAEAICRSGVGRMTLIDLDDICISNTNRQLHAMSSTVGKMKVDEMKKRMVDINPECQVDVIYDFVSPDNIDEVLQGLASIDICLDAIDGTKGKVALIAACARYGIPIVTCGGSAGKIDPSKFVCEDLTKVEGDPLLSACRKNLRKLYGFEQGLSFSDKKSQKPTRKWNIRAVYSKEPVKALPRGVDVSSLRRCDGALGTACFVTGTSGFVAAGEVISQIAYDNLIIPRGFSGNKPLLSKC